MRPLAIVALMLASVPAQAAVTLVAHAAGTGGHNNGDTTAAVNTTGATLLVAAIGGYAFGTPGISDNFNNTWVPLASPGGDPVSGITRLYYVANPVVGPGHRVSVTGSGIFATIAMEAFAGVATTTPLEAQSGTSSGLSTSFQAGSVTPHATGDLLVAAIEPGAATSVTISPGTVTDQIPTQSGLNYGVAMAYVVVPSAAPQNPTWTTNVTTVASISIGAFAQASSQSAAQAPAQSFNF